MMKIEITCSIYSGDYRVITKLYSLMITTAGHVNSYLRKGGASFHPPMAFPP